MRNDNVGYDEAKENLNQYNLNELKLEAERFGLYNYQELNKKQIIERILETSIEMGLIKI